MKHLLLFLFVICTVGLHGQTTSADLSNAGEETTPLSKASNILNKFSVTASAGSSAFALNNLNQVNLKGINIGELNISYRLNRRFSFGVSTMGSLSTSAAGYYNAENTFVSFCDDDDDDDDDDDEIDDDDEMDDDDEDDDDEDEDCDDDEIEFGQNLMGTVTFKLSEKLPLFIQAGGGYSFAGNAPAYTAMIGYNQRIFSGFGILAGVRFSDVLRQAPKDAIKTVSPAGLKAELGLTWNF